MPVKTKSESSRLCSVQTNLVEGHPQRKHSQVATRITSTIWSHKLPLKHPINPDNSRPLCDASVWQPGQPFSLGGFHGAVQVRRLHSGSPGGDVLQVPPNSLRGFRLYELMDGADGRQVPPSRIKGWGTNSRDRLK